MALQMLVGLGNFRGSYENTPHNIGFHILDSLSLRTARAWTDHPAGFSEAPGEGSPRLIKPHSYMNTSGPVVKRVSLMTQTAPGGILVVCDDFALPWGQLRFRRKGSAGGHNGLSSVIQALGTELFPRLRVGVGPVPPGMAAEDFVLEPVAASKIEELAQNAAEALEFTLANGLDPAMNKYNTSI